MEQTQQKQPTKDMGGRWIVMGDAQYKVPPLNFKQLRELQPKIETLREVKGRMPTAEEWEVIVEVAHAALSRNYGGDLTKEQLIDVLDVGNFKEVFDAIMNVSGVAKPHPGE